MNKKLIIPQISLILLIVGLSGCNEVNNGEGKFSGDIDKVEIIDYKIETYEDKPFLEDVKLADGFDYNIIDKVGYYQVSGTIKNVAGEKLDEIDIKVDFYDKNGNYLISRTDVIKDLANTYSEDFIVEVRSTDKYFENVDNLKFDIRVY
jgi:hypothetical protein